ncbi:EI24 domain-containing protein [Pelagovum pacificum]|uniref:Sulfate transporter family protein n=1 Tax=Pelagovum pacificum TaxID=2588711 RepID=A0A5C5GHB8_9RHOB|nr:EI24 domain-containing protein [Pelagovum pacificum]QQA43247.1 EI24 domain-containing protein [Pelagovum pacificum]TNY33614.1 hypothetical protein FHY64_10180 [Pelagovum pacificum]
MILRDFVRAVGQLSDPRFRRVFLLGIALTFVVLVMIYIGLFWFFEAVLPDFESPLFDGTPLIVSFFLVLMFSIVLMVPVASAMTSLFLDDVAAAVEDRHYPGLPPVPRTSFGDSALDTVNFLGVIIAANLVALVVYVLLPFSTPFLFYALNGYLLGREYFQIAAMRREGRKGAKELFRRHRTEIWMAGILMALPLSIPLVNLLIPILGAATFTHLYHRVSSRRTPGSSGASSRNPAPR